MDMSKLDDAQSFRDDVYKARKKLENTRKQLGQNVLIFMVFSSTLLYLR